MIELLEGEVFLPVVGYEGLYIVSNLGRVYSLPRIVPLTDTKWMTKKGMFMKIYKNPHGYYSLKISKEGKTKLVRNHVLVAQAFIPNPKGLKAIDHIDGCKDNFKASNLRYCTYRQNVTFSNVTKTKSKNTYVGVSEMKNGTFRARILINNKALHLGYFKTAEAASEAYLAAVPQNDKMEGIKFR